MKKAEKQAKKLLELNDAIWDVLVDVKEGKLDIEDGVVKIMELLDEKQG